MKFLRSLLLYTALGLGANTAFASDASQFDALKTGDMRKLAWAKSDAMKFQSRAILTKPVRK